jgi:hypothetical protein
VEFDVKSYYNVKRTRETDYQSEILSHRILRERFISNLLLSPGAICDGR